jgi:hypothetical protein
MAQSLHKLDCSTLRTCNVDMQKTQINTSLKKVVKVKKYTAATERYNGKQ